MARFRTLLVNTADDFRLQVNCYEPFEKRHVEHAVIINSGAGIPQTFYGPFATWLADHGFHVFTYDYRGIGGSRGATIRHLRASIQDWGSKDCAATLSYVRRVGPDAKLYILGHSIGSVVTGFVSQVPKIERMVLVSPHTGYFGDYDSARRWKMFVAWHISMPLLARVFGYFPGRHFGLPEDLPYSVAMEWAGRRCEANLRGDQQFGHFDQLATEALVLRPVDDPFATKAAVNRIRARFSSTRFVERLLPMNCSIGHFGFFRRPYRDSLWPIVPRWLALGEISPELAQR